MAICKNCGNESFEKYCGQCSQEVDTHRLSFKHFLAHDIAHGLFHIDKKLPHTILAILKKPGTVAHDYIAGKRKKYYSFFYLLLIMLGVYLFFESMIFNETVTDGSAVSAPKFFDDNFKFIVFLFVPLIASVSWLLYLKLGYNIIECHVFGVVALIGIMTILTINIFFAFIFQLLHWDSINIFKGFLKLLDYLAYFFYPIYALFQYSKHKFTLAGRIWRALLTWFILITIFWVTLVSIVMKDMIDTSGLTFKEFIKVEMKKNKTLRDSTNRKVAPLFNE